jgi:3-phosphoshikimate 1-carboxyvinyltransferase
MPKPQDVVNIEAPPSKSVSHRAFICAALANGVSRVSNSLDSDDLIRTRACLSACGAGFEATPQGWDITGTGGRPRGGLARPADLDVGESGTTCRLLTAVAASGRGLFRVHGAGRMHKRPIGQLTKVLEGLGARFSFEDAPGYPPFVIETQGLSGGTAVISLEESSQYLSGLLLAAPLARSGLRVEIGGSKAVSWPYVSLTLMAMADFGAQVAVEVLEQGAWSKRSPAAIKTAAPGQVRFTVLPGAYQARPYRVEADWSNASYFLGAGAIGPKPVRVSGLRLDSLQGDRVILDILEAMGAEVLWDGSLLTISPAGLRGLELDMGPCPDLVPTVAVCAALGQGRTVIRNVAHLRLKESDRLEACAVELKKIGAKVETLADGLAIEPGPSPEGKRFELSTYDDHRMAMSLSLLGLVGAEVVLDNPGCVAKSFPGFWEQRKKLPWV